MAAEPHVVLAEAAEPRKIQLDDDTGVESVTSVPLANEGYATFASSSPKPSPSTSAAEVIYRPTPNPDAVHPASKEKVVASDSTLGSLDTSFIDNVLKRLVVGNVTYNWPEKVPTNGWTTIELIIGVHKTPEELGKILNDIQSSRVSVRGVTVSDQAKLSNKMQASLSGPDFDIKPSDPVIKPLAGTEATIWEWTVKPKTSGDLLLTMKLEAIITDGQKETPWAVQTWERNIKVETSIWETFKEFLNETIFKPGNFWQWIVVPIAAAIWMMIKKWWQKMKGRTTKLLGREEIH